MLEEEKREERSNVREESSVWVSPTTFAVIVALGVGFLNYRKLNLDLFEKRYKSYSEMLRQISAYEKARVDMQAKEAGLESISAEKAKFEDASREMSFLFGPDVVRRLQELKAAYTRADDVISDNVQGEDAYTRSMRLERERRGARTTIDHTIGLLKQDAQRYLQFWGVWERAAHFVHTIPGRIESSRWWAEWKIRDLRTKVPAKTRDHWNLLRDRLRRPKK